MKKKIERRLKTKSDIISEISIKKDLPADIVGLVVDTVIDEISHSLLRGGKVELRGFGTFGVKNYKAYKGRNPQNQQKIMVRAKKRPWFRPGLIREALKK